MTKRFALAAMLAIFPMTALAADVPVGDQHVVIAWEPSAGTVTPTVAVAQADTGFPVPEIVERVPVGDELGWLTRKAQALKKLADDKAWGPFVSMLIMALMSAFFWALTKVKRLQTWSGKHKGVIVTAATMLGYLMVDLASLAPGASIKEWGSVLGHGAVVGLAAVGGFEVVWKRILKPIVQPLLNKIFKAKS